MAAASASKLVALKSLFIVLACTMAAAVAYALAMDGYSSCYDPTAWWTMVAEANFLVFIFLVVAWFFYKESSWIKRVVFTFAVFWCGSSVLCGYIVMLLFKMNTEESLKDPIYYVLVRHQNRDDVGHISRSYVIAAKVIVTALICYMLGVTVCAYMIDGSPFYVEVLTPCMIGSTIDVSIHIVVFSVWIAYKESSWIYVVIGILLLVCFSGIGLCVYIMRELFNLSPDHPLSSILFSKNNRDATTSEPLLTENSNI